MSNQEFLTKVLHFVRTLPILHVLMRNLLRFFVSLKTAILLLAVLGIIAMLGTFVPQKAETIHYFKMFPRAAHWILATGADDIYHSTIFYCTLGLLAVSTLICTLFRLSITRKKFYSRLELASPNEINSLPVQTDLPVGKELTLKDSNWQVKTLDGGGHLYFRASGKTSLLGGLFIHIGLLLILSGGIIDAYLGVETMISGTTGEKLPLPQIEGIRAGMKADKIRRNARRIQHENPNDPRLEEFRKTIDELDKIYQNSVLNPYAKILIEKLWIDKYENASGAHSHIPRNWNSQIVVEKDGIPVASGVIKVNSPFYFENYSFFQADWNKKYSAIKLTVEVLASNTTNISSDTDLIYSQSPESKSYELVLSPNVPTKPDWSPYTFVLLDFWPDFAIVNEEFVSLSNNLNNPAGRLIAYDHEEKPVGRAWAFSRRQMAAIHPVVSNMPYRFIIDDAETIYETGIQVTSYPGTPIVWIGSLLFSLGLFLAFYVAYIEEWILVRKSGRITLAISGNRPHTVLRKYLTQLTNSIAS